jgi:SAM-dependent methyltransferase
MGYAEADLEEFYEASYSQPNGEKYGRWRQIGAGAKADHVERLARSVGLNAPAVVAEIGCGDGAVLDALWSRGFGKARIGYEISTAAAALAADRPGVDEVHVFDGRSLPVADGMYDVVVCSHVLEHAHSPAALLREMARVGRWIIVEVPLEANLSARRPGARAASRAAGHLHRFSRRDVRGLVAGAGMRIEAELCDPLPLAVHLFDRTSRGSKVRGYAKWAIRTAVARIPTVGERLITLHYALAARSASDVADGTR